MRELPTHPNGEGLWQLGLCPWWLGGRSEALRHSSCESGVATRGPDACVWTSPAPVPAAEEYAGDPVVVQHQCREWTGLPIWVSFEETVENEQQTFVGKENFLLQRRHFRVGLLCRMAFDVVREEYSQFGLFFSWDFTKYIAYSKVLRCRKGRTPVAFLCIVAALLGYPLKLGS